MRPPCQLSAAAAFVFTVVLLSAATEAQTGSKYRVLHDFGSTGDGSIPSGPLTLDVNGNLYGATGAGGGIGCSGYGCGTVFKLAKQFGGGWREESLHDFGDNGDGADPVSNVVFDPHGNLYGTLAGAGPGQTAVVELSSNGGDWNISMLYDQGVGPGLLSDKFGDIYGFLGPGQFQAGAIAKLSPDSNGWAYTDLYSFCSDTNCTNGDEPYSPLTWDLHGNLYGTTLLGGIDYPKCSWSGGCGVAFQMTPNSDGTWTYHVMHRFASFKGDGERPYAGLVVDAEGKAYGAAWAGGPNGSGTIFKLTPEGLGWKQTTIYDFPNCAEGCGPTTTLTLDNAGNLYGSAAGGNSGCGPYTCGTIFKLSSQTNGQWKYSVLHKFSASEGYFPWGVIVDPKGNIFGTTSHGGTYRTGIAFEITP